MLLLRISLIARFYNLNPPIQDRNGALSGALYQAHEGHVGRHLRAGANINYRDIEVNLFVIRNTISESTIDSSLLYLYSNFCNSDASDTSHTGNLSTLSLCGEQYGNYRHIARIRKIIIFTFCFRNIETECSE